jgi:hypothetical protein
MSVGRVTQQSNIQTLPVVREVIILTDHRRRNPFPLMSKGERNFIKGKLHKRKASSQGEFCI